MKQQYQQNSRPVLWIAVIVLLAFLVTGAQSLFEPGNLFSLLKLLGLFAAGMFLLWLVVWGISYGFKKLLGFLPAPVTGWINRNGNRVSTIILAGLWLFFLYNAWQKKMYGLIVFFIIYAAVNLYSGRKKVKS